MLQVSATIPTKTGTAPKQDDDFGGGNEGKGRSDHLIPGLMPIAIKRNEQASVPLATVMQCVAGVEAQGALRVRELRAP